MNVTGDRERGMGKCLVKKARVLPNRRDHSWAQIFSTGPLPGSKVPINGDTLPHLTTGESIPEASPPIRDGLGVAWAGRIVTSTNLSNRPIGPTAHSQRCENAGKKN